MAERFFPILPWKYAPKVPWDMVAPHSPQAMRNHGQTLERLAERGGLSPTELVAVLEDRPWRKMPDADARLADAIAAWQAGRERRETPP